MPRFSPNGQHLAAGVGGHAVYVDGPSPIATNAGGIAPLDDEWFIYQRAAHLEKFSVRTREVVHVSPLGATYLVAGGGEWAAEYGPQYHGSRGPLARPPVAFGPDGSYAEKIAVWGGLILNGVELSRVPFGYPGIENVQVLGPTTATWTEARRPAAHGMPVPQAPAGEVFALRVHRGWALAHIGGRLLLYPVDDAAFGFVIATFGPENPYGFFRPDLHVEGNLAKVCWSTTEGEPWGDLRIVTLNLLDQKLDLREHTPMSDVLATLKTVRAKYPERGLTPDQLGALLNEVAWVHRAEGVGLQRKDGGESYATQPRTGIRISQDILRFADNRGRDVLADGEGAAEPKWGDSGPADPGTFVTPVDPTGTTDPPKGYVTKAELAAELSRLKAELLAEGAKPIALKSVHGKYLSAQPDGSVQCNRDAAQSWETFNVER